MKLFTERTSTILIWTGLVILILSLFLFLFRANIFQFNQNVDSQIFDHFGSLIGGLVGSIWTLASIILFYIALVEQRKATNHQREAIDDQKKAIEINVKALNAQVESLKIQTKEFELQRQELTQTREVFSEQSKTLKLQQFESTFFNMLNLHHQIVNAIDIVKTDFEYVEGSFLSFTDNTKKIERTLNARDCFAYFYSEYQDYYQTNAKEYEKEREGGKENELINKSYTKFYNHYQSDLGHYFRNLYNILKFIDKKNPGDKYFYSNLLRAQLSPYELIMLFYNSLSQFGEEKFKPLMEEFHFLQNIHKPFLINRKTQMPLYKDNVFGKPKDI